MRVRNCPYCFGTGSIGHIGRCGFCHGKKKVTSEFIKWLNARVKEECKLTDRLRETMEDRVQKEIQDKMKDWDKEHPKPLKFPKIQ